MEVRTTSLGRVPLLEIEGEIDHSNCHTLEAALAAALNGEATSVLLDLTQVSYVDSGGLAIVLSAMRRLRDRGWLGVIGPNPNLTRLLEIVGLLVDPGFRVFADRTEAAVLVGQAAE